MEKGEMMRLWLIAVAVLCACGPSAEQECEKLCELFYKCLDGEMTVEQVGECESDCTDDAEDSPECLDAIAELNACTGGQCGQEECASEADNLADECS
jgi:hypothetical protein